jgi:hypothetical protein
MEDERTYNINHSNVRFILHFNNRIEENRNFNIINYIHNYDRNEPNRNLYNRNLYSSGPRSSLSLLATCSSLSGDEIVLPSLISDDELVFSSLISDEKILLPTFTEQELLIPDDAECGITFEKPDCRTSCAHHFCRADITKWLEQQKNEGKKMTCPTCRATISEVLVAKNK